MGYCQKHERHTIQHPGLTIPFQVCPVCLRISQKSKGEKMLTVITLQEYQEEARKTAIYPNVGENLQYVVLGLCGEGGEIANKVKKIARDSDGVMSDEVKKQIFKELGDTLWYLSNICDEVGLSLEDVANNNILKLRSRQKRGKLKGSGDDR